MTAGTVGMRKSVLGWALFLMAVTPGSAVAEESYYLLVFGSQQTPPRAKYSHSFATFVRAAGPGLCGEGGALEAHTISWLPRSLEIRLFAFLPECGQNFDLDTSVRVVMDTNQRVSMWGPYQIDADLYNRAVKQVQVLQSGKVRYKALDTGYRSDDASNCIHAITSILGGYRTRVLSPSFGETASYIITRRMEPRVIDSCARHDWVATSLGLNQYPIIRRGLEPPRSGLIWGALPFGLSQIIP